MCLAERGSRHRRGIDPLVHDRQGRPEFGLGERPDRLEVDRRHLILQALELGRDLGRQHVQARGHELPHLDHEAAERHGEGVEVPRETLQPARASAGGE